MYIGTSPQRALVYLTIDTVMPFDCEIFRLNSSYDHNITHAINAFHAKGRAKPFEKKEMPKIPKSEFSLCSEI